MTINDLINTLESLKNTVPGLEDNPVFFKFNDDSLVSLVELPEVMYVHKDDVDHLYLNKGYESFEHFYEINSDLYDSYENALYEFTNTYEAVAYLI